MTKLNSTMMQKENNTNQRKKTVIKIFIDIDILIQRWPYVYGYRVPHIRGIIMHSNHMNLWLYRYVP